jgi:hypothetical protein
VDHLAHSGDCGVLDYDAAFTEFYGILVAKHCAEHIGIGNQNVLVHIELLGCKYWWFYTVININTGI